MRFDRVQKGGKPTHFITWQIILYLGRQRLGTISILSAEPHGSFPTKLYNNTYVQNFSDWIA